MLQGLVVLEAEPRVTCKAQVERADVAARTAAPTAARLLQDKQRDPIKDGVAHVRSSATWLQNRARGSCKV